MCASIGTTKAQKANILTTIPGFHSRKLAVCLWFLNLSGTDRWIFAKEAGLGQGVGRNNKIESKVIGINQKKLNHMQMRRDSAGEDMAST